MRFVIGVFLAALAMFMWGFVFFGSGLFDIHDHLSPAQEQAASQALASQIPASGFYMLPDTKNGSTTELAARMRSGPFVRLHFHKGGVSFEDPTVMGKGFLHMLVVCFLFALALRAVWSPGSPYFRRLRIAFLFGLGAAAFAQLGGPIWWHATWTPAFKMALYDFVSYFLAGSVLAKTSY